METELKVQLSIKKKIVTFEKTAMWFLKSKWFYLESGLTTEERYGGVN